MNKNDIIPKVYYDLAGYGSNAATFEDAKKYDPSITLQDIKDWKTKDADRKTNLKGYYSFMADKPFQEFQLICFSYQI